jgi:hypothetical protein
MALKKATKEQAKLRMALYGLSGGGKTYSSLAMATGLVQVLGGKIAALDTEFRSASKYANQFEFITDDFGRPSIENYIKFIEMVKEEGDVTVLVIDSLTHAWQYVLEMVDKLKETTCHGDGRKAWAIMTPEYKKLINAILTAPFHIIGTMRAKTEWSTTSEGGHKTVRRDTLAPEQRDGFEYEFDMLMELNANHYGTIIKDRTNKFQDEIIQKPGIEFGRKLAEWLNDGAVSMGSQIQAALLEIGNIIKSKSESGAMYFTDQEYESIRLMCKESGKQSQEARLDFLQNILVEQKKILQKRVDQFEAPASVNSSQAVKQETPPVAQPEPIKQEAPPQAPETSEPAIPSLPDEEKLLSGKLPEDASPATEDFDDDIPWEEIDKPTSTKDPMTIGKNGDISLTQTFKDYLKEHKKDDAVATAEELDIF